MARIFRALLSTVCILLNLPLSGCHYLQQPYVSTPIPSSEITAGVDATPSEPPPPKEGKMSLFYISLLGKSAGQISESFSISFDKWEFGGWDGGSPYFMDGEDGVSFYFDYSDISGSENETDDIVLEKGRICVRVDFLLNKIFTDTSSISIDSLEEEFGSTFEYSEEANAVGALIDEKFLVIVGCNEDFLVSKDSYICILDKRAEGTRE